MQTLKGTFFYQNPQIPTESKVLIKTLFLFFQSFKIFESRGHSNKM